MTAQSAERRYDYYLWMLLMRRRAFEVADERFEREHGRAPDEAEREVLRKELEKELGPGASCSRRRVLATCRRTRRSCTSQSSSR